MSNKRRLIRGSAWAISGTVVSNVFALVVLAILARHLTPHDFGMIAFIVLFIEVSTGILLSGLPDALARQKQWDDELASSALWANFAVALLLIALSAAGALVLWQIGSTTSALLLLALSPAFLIDSSIGIADSRMRFDFRFRGSAARQITGTAVGGVLAIAAVLAGFGLWALVIQRIAGSLAQAVLVWSVLGWRPHLRFSWGKLRPVVEYSLHLTGANALAQVNFRAVDFAIGVFLGPSALAMYQIAGRGLNILTQATIAPVQRVALVTFAKLDDAEAVGRAYLKTTRFVALASFPVFIGMAAIAHDFIPLMFGPQWGQASIILVFMALMVGAYSMSYFYAPALSALGRSKPVFNYYVVTTLSSALVATIFAQFGLVWMAAAMTVRSYLVLPLALHFVKRETGLHPIELVRAMVPLALASATMAGSLVAMQHYLLADWQPLLRMVATIVAGGILYPLALLVFARGEVRLAVGEFAPGLASRFARILGR